MTTEPVVAHVIAPEAGLLPVTPASALENPPLSVLVPNDQAQDLVLSAMGEGITNALTPSIGRETKTGLMTNLSEVLSSKK